MEFVLASHNKHKAEEIKNILGKAFEIITQDEAGFTGEVIEDGKTFEENAVKKAERDFLNKYIEAYVWGVQDGTVKRIDNVELFYYSTTHALLNLCKTLSYSGVLVSQDEKTSKEDEIKALIDIILYRLSNK